MASSSSSSSSSSSAMAAATAVAMMIMLVFVSAADAAAAAPKPALVVGFYNYTCPYAELIVQKYVNKFLYLNPGLGAGLIRLHFHDCFVRGCDASVLLDGPNSEKESIPNKGSLRGFEIIDAAKAELELVCPGIVSCADVLAFAARDSAAKLGNIRYKVPSGRRDGNVSDIIEPLLNLPAPFFNVTTLGAFFARKGFSFEEMVVLAGAHSIGVAHCTSFNGRLYPTADPTLDANYAAKLKKTCPAPAANSTLNPTVSFDTITPNCLDNGYYRGLRVHKGLLTSDQELLASPLTSKHVVEYAENNEDWKKDFAAAMVRMGKIEVLTGKQGQIRRNCHLRN